MTELSVTQYAKKLKVTRQAVLAQIKDSRLAKNVTPKKIGSTWILTINNLEDYPLGKK